MSLSKDYYLPSSKKKLQTFKNFSSDKNDPQYNSLNLNQSHKYSSKADFLQSSKNVSIFSDKEKQNYENKVSKKSQKTAAYNNKKVSTNFHQTKSGLSNSNFTSTPSNLMKQFDDDEKMEEQKRWKKEGSNSDTTTKNSSTLSLHISAYENSIASNCQQNSGNKKWKNVHHFNSTIQNLFELPRQQEDCKNNEPEIMQFKASQKLLDPNHIKQQQQQKKASQEKHNIPPTDRSFQLNVEPSTRVVFAGDWLKELSTTLKITNKSDSRQAYKVKCTRNDLFRIRPPSGILDFNASIEVQLSFKPTGNEPESDKHHVGIYHIPAPEGSTASGAWAEHYGPPQGEKRLKICFENTD